MRFPRSAQSNSIWIRLNCKHLSKSLYECGNETILYRYDTEVQSAWLQTLEEFKQIIFGLLDKELNNNEIILLQNKAKEYRYYLKIKSNKIIAIQKL